MHINVAFSKPAKGLVWCSAMISAMLLISGCVVPREPSRTPRTAIEQLLVSQAAERSVSELTVPLPAASKLYIDIIGLARLESYVGKERTQFSVANTQQGLVYGPPTDLSFIREMVAARLGRGDFRIAERSEDAAYVVRIIVHAVGTEQGETFFGARTAQSFILPFSLPDLPLYAAQYQKAHMRFTLDIYESNTGRFLRSMPAYAGEAYYNQYTVLFFISFKRTDLVQPP
jgi:hypothetical protein